MIEEQNLHTKERYPTILYASLQEHIRSQHPDLVQRTNEQSKQDFERITRKARKGLPYYKDWREMDRALKGDPYALNLSRERLHKR